MDDDIAVVHQNPVCGAVALYLAAWAAGLCESLLHIVRHGLNLAGVRSVCDYEIISQDRNVPDIYDFNVFSFFFFDGLYGCFC